jgi:periplasmic protein CpxP/Spy
MSCPTNFPKSKRFSILLAGVFAASLASSAVMAGPADHHDCDGPGANDRGSDQRMSERMNKHHSERMAKLYAALKLKPEQESAWKQLQSSTQLPVSNTPPAELAKDTPTRLDQMLARHDERTKRLQTHVKAEKDFYAVLTPEQKKIFDDFHDIGRRPPR